MPSVAKLIQRDIFLCQGMTSPHDTHILAVVQTVVLKGNGLARLSLGGQVSQHGRKVAQCQICDALIEHVSGVAGGQR